MSYRTRELDEHVLSMIECRIAGMTVTEIAKVIGQKVQYVSMATNRVREDDRYYSGDPESEIDAAYWQ